MKGFSFGKGLLVGGFIGLIIGGVIGLAGGEANAYIDFCMDDGMRKYIVDDTAREASCS